MQPGFSDIIPIDVPRPPFTFKTASFLRFFESASRKRLAYETVCSAGAGRILSQSLCFSVMDSQCSLKHQEPTMLYRVLYRTGIARTSVRKTASLSQNPGWHSRVDLHAEWKTERTLRAIESDNVSTRLSISPFIDLVAVDIIGRVAFLARFRKFGVEYLKKGMIEGKSKEDGKQASRSTWIYLIIHAVAAR